MAEGTPTGSPAELRTVLLAGATGLVGGHALTALLDASDIGRVLAVTRRPLGRDHPRLANRIVQFDRIESQLQGLTADAAICCMGTTLRQAGSEAAFRAQEFEPALAFARAASTTGAKRFVYVSSVGANAASRYLYLRVKGEIEQALEKLGYASLDLLQPSALVGWRRELRPAELAARLVVPLVNPFLRGERERFRGIAAETVAAAMLGALRSGRRGVYRYTYTGLRALAKSRPRSSAEITGTQNQLQR